MTFFDSHAHLGDDDLFPDIDQVLLRAQAANVASIVNICTSAITLERGLLLAGRHPWILNAAAITPHDACKEGDALFALIEKHALSGDLVAIGETGLDYHYYADTKKEQQQLFCRYIQLALSCRLPLIIHCREAFKDLLQLLDTHYITHADHIPGVLHCFTGTGIEAKELISRGWYLSFSGIVTYKKSDDLRQIAKLTPIDQILIETDSPYLAPASRRGDINEPGFLGETASIIAKEKGISIEELAKHTTANAQLVFQKRTRKS